MFTKALFINEGSKEGRKSSNTCIRSQKAMDGGLNKYQTCNTFQTKKQLRKTELLEAPPPCIRLVLPYIRPWLDGPRHLLNLCMSENLE